MARTYSEMLQKGISALATGEGLLDHVVQLLPENRQRPRIQQGQSSLAAANSLISWARFSTGRADSLWPPACL
jgi:hypothetical protein